jgi:hypothetical protein
MVADNQDITRLLPYLLTCTAILADTVAATLNQVNGSGLVK